MFANIIKTFPKLLLNEAPESLLKQADNMLSASKIFQRMESKSKIPETSDKTYSFLKGLIDRGNDFYKKESLYSDVVSHTKGDKTKINEYSTKFFEEKIDLTYNGAISFKEKLIKNYELSFQNEDKITEALHNKYFNLAVYNPKKLEEIANISKKDIFLAHKGIISTREKLKKDFLIRLHKAYKNIDSQYIKTFSDVANVGNLKEYILPVWALKDEILKIDTKDLSSLLQKNTSIKDPLEALKTAEKMQQYVLDSAKTKKPPNLYSKIRNLQFDSPEAEYNFISAINGFWTNGTSLLQSIITNKEKGVIRGMFYKEFGTNPLKNIEQVISRLRKENKLPEANLKNIKHKLQYVFNVDVSNKGAMLYFTDALDKIGSALYGAVASLPRQIFIDVTAHSSAIRKHSFNKSPAYKYIQNKMFKPLVPLFKNLSQSALGQNRTTRNQLTNLLDVLGFSSYNSAQFKTFGFGYENALQMNEIGGSNTVEYVGSYLSYMAGKFNEIVHTLAGNTFHYDTVNAITMLNNSSFFTNTLLKSADYEDIVKAFGNKTRYFEDFFGLGADEFNALKQVNRTKINKSKFGDFIENDIEIITINDILDLDDSIADLYKKKHETVKEFKQRLSLNFRQMMSDQMSTHQTHLTKTRLFTDRYVKRGTFIDLVLRPTIFKFINITDAQYQNLRRATGIYLFGSPFEAKFTQSFNNQAILKAWLENYGWYIGSGFSLLWFKDIMNGRSPRPVNFDNYLYTQTQSGIFGVPGMVYKLADNLVTKGKTGDILSSYVKSTSDAVKGKNVGKWGRRTSGVGQIWYLDPVVAFLNNKNNQRYDETLKIYDERLLM